MTDYSDRIEKLCDVYLCWLLSTDRDAGHHVGASIIGRWMEFKGDVPPPSGNDTSNDKMIHEMRFLRNPHHDLARAKEIINGLKPIYRDAIVAHTRHASQHPEWKIALAMHIRPPQYRDRKRMARKKMAEALAAYPDEVARVGGKAA